MSMMNTIGEFAKGYIIGYAATKGLQMIAAGVKANMSGAAYMNEQAMIQQTPGYTRINTPYEYDMYVGAGRWS